MGQDLPKGNHVGFNIERRAAALEIVLKAGADKGSTQESEQKQKDLQPVLDVRPAGRLRPVRQIAAIVRTGFKRVRGIWP
jgi:hypothetical protein